MWIIILVIVKFFSLGYGETVAGLILARGGSKEVRLKNLQEVGGVSLVRRAVTVGRAAGLVDVTVATDHPLIALEALRSNASVFHRSSITATDWAPSIWGVAEFLAYRPDVEILVLQQATSPFVKPAHLRSALRKINTPMAYDCVFSVTRSFKLRWYLKNSRPQPLNFKVDQRPRRQDWPGELVETGSFYITRRHLLNEGKFQNDNMTNPSDNITFEELEAIDVINVDLVPERKGLILKHCEYYVSSRRHGTTVTRRYNDFVQLYEVLSAKYPYRAVCRLPPKRVVVGGGSAAFVRKRRAALQRWLTLAARHPVMGHDADLRAFLCEPRPKIERPRHDEFELAGTQAHEESEDESIEELEAALISDQEQLRLIQLGLGRLEQIFERAEQRCTAEASDVRELGAALVALAAPAARDSPRWAQAKRGMKQAAEVANAASAIEEPEDSESAAEDALATALEALGAARELGSRLRRGAHAERAHAAPRAPALRHRHLYALRAARHVSTEDALATALEALGAARELGSRLRHGAHDERAHAAPRVPALRHRHLYAPRAARQEASVSLAYALRGVSRAAAALGATGAAHARHAALWARLHAAATQHSPP